MGVVHEDLSEEKIHFGFSADKATYTVTCAVRHVLPMASIGPYSSSIVPYAKALRPLEHIRKGLGLFLRQSSLIFPAMGICADDIPCHLISRSSS